MNAYVREDSLYRCVVVTEKLIKITCESFFELVDGNEYAIWISS